MISLGSQPAKAFDISMTSHKRIAKEYESALRLYGSPLATSGAILKFKRQERERDRERERESKKK